MTKGEIRHELAKAKKELKDAWICGEGYEYDQNFIVCYKDGTVLETREANERLPQIGIIGIQFFGTDAHYTVGYEMYNGEKVLIEDESEDACYRVEYLPLTSTEATAETETVETEVAEKFIIYVSDDDLNVFCAKVFVGTVKELDDECDRIIAETNCEEYLHVLCYTDKRWEWIQKHYNQVSKSALSVVVRKTETAEQETAETVEGISKTETTAEADDSGFEYYSVETAEVSKEVINNRKEVNSTSFKCADLSAIRGNFYRKRDYTMTNAMIILIESVRLMEDGIIEGTGEMIEVEDSNGNKKYLEVAEPIHTYQAWQELGYQVRKGEKAIAKFPIWKYSESKRKDDNEQEKARAKMFMKVSAFFKLSQVDRKEQSE